MRLLLDEQISARVAQELRSRGHDVVTVSETELRGVADEDVLAWAAADRRVVVTNDIRDFRLLHARHLTMGVAHYGIVLVSGRSHDLRRAGAGGLATALETLLADLPAEDALRDLEHFL